MCNFKTAVECTPVDDWEFKLTLKADTKKDPDGNEQKDYIVEGKLGPILNPFS